MRILSGARVRPGAGLRLAASGARGVAPSGQLFVQSFDMNIATATPTLMFWESAYTTADGRIVDAWYSDHQPDSNNGVRAFDPLGSPKVVELATQQTYNTGGNIGAVYGYPSPYDNTHYYYNAQRNSLVWPGPDTGFEFSFASNTWVRAWRGEQQGASWVTSGTALHDGQPLGQTHGEVTLGTNTNAIARPIGTLASDADLRIATTSQNPHQTYSAAYDCAIRIGGGQGGAGRNDQIGQMYITVPSGPFGTFSQPYVTFLKTMPATVGGAQPYKKNGRDGCCTLGEYVYWVGGEDFPTEGNPVPRPHFFRMKFTEHLTSDSVSLTTGAGAIERLTDAPCAGSNLMLLRADPVNNALVLWARDNPSIHVYDVTNSAWVNSSVLSALNTAYTAEYLSAADTPAGCMGDFIGVRSGTTLNTVYWRPGLPGLWGTDNSTNLAQRCARWRSLKLGRA